MSERMAQTGNSNRSDQYPKFVLPSGDFVNEPRISIVTAVYNCEATIQSTLESVAHQSYSNVEHIVIDGGSSDSTLDVVKACASADIVVSEPDNGIYDAFNRGLRQASGDIVLFLNGDDYYASEDVLLVIAKHYTANPGCILLGDVVFFSSEDPLRKVTRFYDSSKFRVDRLSWGWMPAHPGMVVPRGIFERFGGFDDTYKIAGDFELSVRLFWHERQPYRHIDKTLVCMQMGGESTRGLASNLTILNESLAACKAYQLKTNRLKLASKFVTKLSQFVKRPQDIASKSASQWWQSSK
ncbi:MAG: glycosyltransferase family 2 protein [Pseudomonadota bacterium]